MRNLNLLILSLIMLLTAFAAMKGSYGFTEKSTKSIYPVTSLKSRASRKIVYGIYSRNKYWAITKKPVYSKLVKNFKRKKIVYPYKIKLFMRFK